MLIALVFSIALGHHLGRQTGLSADFTSMLGALFGSVHAPFLAGDNADPDLFHRPRLAAHIQQDNLARSIMPSLSLGLSLMAMFARLTRSVMLDVLNQDYVRTARAKGLMEKMVIGKHALKNAMIPLVTVAGMQFGFLIGGTVIIETVFAWPGVGRLVVQAIFTRDYPLVQAAVLVLSVLFVLINLLTDLIYLYLDPQISFLEAK